MKHDYILVLERAHQLGESVVVRANGDVERAADVAADVVGVADVYYGEGCGGGGVQEDLGEGGGGDVRERCGGELCH